jgi:hypothetical protein
MKIAVVGSRAYPDPVEVANFILSLPLGTIIVSGGAEGVDSWAANTAHFVMGFQTIIKWPDWRNKGKAASFIRNQEIVDEADEVVMFWNGASKGTADTCRRTTKSGKQWRLIQKKEREGELD